MVVYKQTYNRPELGKILYDGITSSLPCLVDANDSVDASLRAKFRVLKAIETQYSFPEILQALKKGGATKTLAKLEEISRNPDSW